MAKGRSNTKADLDVIDQKTSNQKKDEKDNTGDAEASSTFDPHIENLISKQANSALLHLLFYSIMMFTLPFGAFFGTQHVLRTHTDWPAFTITSLSVASAVIVVYIIIALYIYKAYNEKDVVPPGYGESKANSQKEEKKNKKKLN